MNNTPNLTYEQSVERFSNAPWFNPQLADLRIAVVGVGGVGSWVAFFLSRLGLFKTITVFDDDEVDTVNLAGQLFSVNELQINKAAAICNIVTQFSPYAAIAPLSRKFTNADVGRFDIIFMCPDNLTTRHQTALKIIEDNLDTLIIDGRLLAEQFEVFCVNKTNALKYIEEQCPEESSIQDAPCNFRQTTHVASMIGSYMVGILTNHLTNIMNGKSLRKVPYQTRFYTSLIMTTTNGKL